MNKQLIALATALLMGAAMAGAKAFDPVFKEFKAEKSVETVNVPSWMMKIARKCGEAKDLSAVEKIQSMRVLTMAGKKNAAVRTRLSRRIESLGNGLEEVMSARDGNDNVKIWFETSGKEEIKTIYIFAADEEDLVLTEFNGKFTRDDINALVREAQK